MLFSSLSFVVFFLPVVIFIHSLCPPAWRNVFLFLSSVVFYAFGELKYIPFILSAVLLNYFLSILISQFPKLKQIILVFSIFINIGSLIYFKYLAFLFPLLGINNTFLYPTMPLGISFLTFQMQSYIVDVYRKTVLPERNIISMMTYLILFPQLIAGPIVLYADVSKELKIRNINIEDLELGMMVFIAGLSSKVLIANPLGRLLGETLSSPMPSMPLYWLSTFVGVLQLYFDFSGYSFMAVGIGKMLGFNFPKNFNHPFSAHSVQAFWSRWHITLGTWMKNYLYIPLGGNRMGKWRSSLNLFIVWFFSGLWHGADINHILWGVWFFVWIALERTRFGSFIIRHKKIGVIYAQLVFFFSWPLFNFNTLSESINHFSHMFNFRFSTDFLFYLRSNGVLLIFSALFCVPLFTHKLNIWLRKHLLSRFLIYTSLLVLCIAALASESYNPFIYFRF